MDQHSHFKIKKAACPFTSGQLMRHMSIHFPAHGFEAALSCACYMFFSVSLTLVNKAVFSNASLDFPWLLLGFQSIFVCSNLVLSRFIARKVVFKPDLFRQMLVPSVAVTVYVFSSARSLKYLSIPVITVIKSLAPICIAFVESVLFQEYLNTEVLMAMALVVLSNIVSLSNDRQFVPVGYFWAFVNVGFNIFYVLSLRVCLAPEHDNSEKNLHSNLCQALFQIPIGILCGEVPSAFKDLPSASLFSKILFLCSCALVAGIGHTLFWSLKLTSASTVSFVGGANKIVVVILGTAFFGAKMSIRGWAGVYLGVLGSIWFALAKKRLSQQSELPKEQKPLNPSSRQLDEGCGHVMEQESCHPRRRLSMFLLQLLPR